jgi:hypothetical protein
MLTGTADVATLADGAATVPAYLRETLVFERVVLFQMVIEMRNGARESVLPPSLHPTIPPALSMQVWQVGASPWGAFRMAVARVSCRGGVRARGFTSAAVASTEAACRGLRDTLGYPARPADIELLATYSGVEAAVADDHGCSFRAAALDPVPMGADDVQYTATLNLAYVPAGLRLLQVDFDLAPERVERLVARLEAFEPSAWGNARLDPYHVVTASLAAGSARFAPTRFLLRPDELAFTGTETVAGDR